MEPTMSAAETPDELIEASKTMHPGLAAAKLEQARRANYGPGYDAALHERLTLAQQDALTRQNSDYLAFKEAERAAALPVFEAAA